MSGEEEKGGGRLDAEGEETLADFLSRFEQGSFQYILTRLEPKQALFQGQMRKASGHLERDAACAADGGVHPR